MKIQKILIIALLLVIILAACAPASPQRATPVVNETAAPISLPTEASGQASTTAVNAALAALMQKLNIDANQIKISSVEAVNWPDTCLGIARPEESCGAMITPGYRVFLEAGGKKYEFRTNQDGSQVRAVEADTPGSEPVTGMHPAVSAAQQALSQQLGVAVDKVTIVSSEPMQWPDGCLGIQTPGMMCTQAIVPGYRVTLEAGGKQYEVRTNEAGTLALPVISQSDTGSIPKTPGVILEWEGTVNGACGKVVIGEQSLDYGPCAGPLSKTTLSAERLEQLKALQSMYAPFKIDSVIGAGDFTGIGAKKPTAAEIRSVAEWAVLAFMEAQGSHASVGEGVAFNWHREGGIAGFCDDLTVYRSGWAAPSSCKTGGSKVMGSYRLSSNELEQLYGWLDQLAPFNYEQKDNASADAMLVQLVWTGTGSGKATQMQQEEIAGFAGQVYTNAVNK